MQKYRKTKSLEVIEQAEDNSEDRVPILVIKRNRSKVYAVLEFDEFLNIIGDKKCKNQ